jgi:EpsI family protein
LKFNKNTIGFVVLMVMLLGASAVSLRLFNSERAAHDKLDVHTFPMTVGEWRGSELPITEREYDILETRNLISREYANPAGEKLYLFIVYSETNRSVFHPPEVCMMGSGLDITDKQIEKFSVGNKVYATNKIFAGKDQYKEIILNCYKAGNIYTSDFYLQQTRLALHQIFGRNVPGATLRVAMSIGKDDRATLTTLKDFLGKAADILDKLTSSPHSLNPEP